MLLSTYIIIFGAAVRANGTPSGSLVRRVQGALAFAQTVRDPKYVATGGVGRYGPAEASVMQEMLLRDGVRSEDIILENRARDTMDSVRFCDVILRTRGDVDKVVPCTSRYHLPRCALLFRMLGYKVRVPEMPTDRPHLPLKKWLFFLLKEFVSLPYDAFLMIPTSWSVRHRKPKS